jgi:hypothetical protein
LTKNKFWFSNFSFSKFGFFQKMTVTNQFYHKNKLKNEFSENLKFEKKCIHLRKYSSPKSADSPTKSAAKPKMKIQNFFNLRDQVYSFLAEILGECGYGSSNQY